jgi:hypothetical protein
MKTNARLSAGSNGSMGMDREPPVSLVAPGPVHRRGLENEARSLALDTVRMPALRSTGVRPLGATRRLGAMEGGRPLDAETREGMEPRLGVALGGVRVHTGSRAGAAAGAVDAQAFTFGSDIFWGSGRYAPSEDDTRQLLAHELVHVDQQAAVGAPFLQRQALAGAAPLEELERARTLAGAAEGKPVLKGGRVAKKEQFIRSAPLPRRDLVTGTLYLNEVLFIDRETPGWYFVVTSTGAEGWVPKPAVAVDPPDPGAFLHFVEKDEKAIDIAARYYRPEEGFAWGDDARFYTAALAYANRDRRGLVFAYHADGTVDWESVRVKSEHTLWIPSREFMRSLKSVVGSQSITYELWQSAKRAIQRVWEWIQYAAGFIAGLLRGAFESIYDLFAGAVELVKAVWSVLKSLFTGSIVSDAKALWNSIKQLDIRKIAGEFADAWEHEDPWERGLFRGRVLGYVIAEILMAVFSFGALTALKWAGRFAKISAVLVKLPKVASIASKVGKAAALRKLPAKAVEVLRQRFGAGPRRAASRAARVAEREIEESFRRTFDLSPPAQAQVPPQIPTAVPTLTRVQVAAAKRLLNKTMAHADMAVFRRLWLDPRVARPLPPGGLTLSNSRRIFNGQRRRFWRAVFDDADAMKILADAGFAITRRGRAPVHVAVPGRHGRLSIDHVTRRATRPDLALDPDNLRFLVHGDNTLIEVLQRAVPDLRTPGEVW